MNRVLVVTRYRQTFTRWCYDNGVDPRDRNVRCITRPDELRGHNGDVVIFDSCWSEDRPAEEIDDMENNALFGRHFIIRPRR